MEFDQRTNGVGQFCELTDAVHRRGGRVLLDMVINHTGWGSALFENHPEWFVHAADGSFASPGAWGVTWEDLVELSPNYVDLWEEVARAFLTWCRRGVDGFRCDAGYKVPVRIWQYIEARVRQEFPQTIFLLEGLGGPWEATEALLTEGGMQWAYSELFQNFGGANVARYLDYCYRQSARVGLYVHYSETHDNDRLAANGRAWSLLRNRLCALTSVSGGFGFTCGVEWLAAEKINVHSSRGLSWGNPDNLLAELAQLNRLLAAHPCFFDGALLTRLSAGRFARLCPAPRFRRGTGPSCWSWSTWTTARAGPWRWMRRNAPASARCNMICSARNRPGAKPPARRLFLTWNRAPLFAWPPPPRPDGLGRRRLPARPRPIRLGHRRVEQGACCPRTSGRATGAPWPPASMPDPRDFLAALPYVDRVKARADLCGALDEAGGKFPQVVELGLIDARRVTPVPPGHWLLLRDPRRFRATLDCGGRQRHVEAIEVRDGFAACFAPQPAGSAADAELDIERHGLTTERVKAALRFLAAAPALATGLAKPPPSSLVLLTNGRGGMARLVRGSGQHPVQI